MPGGEPITLTMEVLRHLVDQSPEPVGLHEQGLLIYANLRLARLLGFASLDEVLERPLLDFVHPEHRDAMVGRLQSHVEAGELAPPFETRALRADGTVLDVETMSSRLVADGRRVVLSSIRDISVRKRAEAMLLRQAAAFETAQRVASFALWTESPGSGHGPQWSSEAYRIFGLDRASFSYSRDRMVQLIAPEDRERVLEARRRMLEEGEPFDEDYRVVRPDGSVRWVHGRGERLSEPDGTGSIVGIVQDITERRALEEQLVQSKKMEAIGRLAGGIAHDFNNLLMVVMGQLTLVERRFSEPELARPALREIGAAVDRAAALTKQLLAFARRQVSHPEVIDLRQALREVESLLARVLGEDVELSMQLEGEPLFVRADRSQLDQVVLNLVVNARDAMPQGGALTLRLSREGGPSDGMAVLEVIDTGHGIPAAIRDRIFDPFFTTKAPGHGSGLGLSTAYAVVEQAGGSIEVQSESGKGASFVVRWPLTSGERPPARDLRLQAPQAQSGSERVLLVEDDPQVRFVLSLGLQDLGYRVETAENAEQALRLLEGSARGVPLVITDVVMPGMSGTALARRALEADPNLRIMLLSGYAADHIDRKLMEERRVRFVQKPVPVMQLSRTVRELLDQRE